MKRRFSYTLAASTLVEMLIVIIVSGILFIALFDGVNLVRRYTNRLNKTLAAGNSLLDSYQQLDHLFLSCDSVIGGPGQSVWIRCSGRWKRSGLYPCGIFPCRWIVLACVSDLGGNFTISSSEGLGIPKTSGGRRR